MPVTERFVLNASVEEMQPLAWLVAHYRGECGDDPDQWVENARRFVELAAERGRWECLGIEEVVT